MTEVAEWTAAQFGRAVAAGGVLLVDLHAAWCGQCGPQRAVLERVAPEFPQVGFGAVDVGAHPAVAEDNEVITLPALLLFADGELHRKLVGFSRAPLVREALDGLIATVTTTGPTT